MSTQKGNPLPPIPAPVRHTGQEPGKHQTPSMPREAQKGPTLKGKK